MGGLGSLTIFIASSFLLAWAILTQKEKMAPRLRRPLATLALILVGIAFVLLVITLFQLN
jgi:heme/copper-type cytochrome/quinol oxidase subunit 3